MKKLFTIIMASLMCLTAAVGLTACGKKDTTLEVKAFELTSEQYAFAIKKGNSDLKTKVDTKLSEMKENGELDKIIDSFFDGTADFSFKNPAEPTNANRADYFVVGTNAYFPPFEMYEGDKLTGVDIKIASVLAESFGKTLYVLDMEFDSLIQSVKTDECDIVMAGMTKNPDREKEVDFAIPYYTSAQVLTVLESDTLFDDCKTVEDVENVLKKQDKKFIVGTQRGTTGFMYSNGDEGFGYDGFTNLTTTPYDTGALAMQDLKNGKINAVILDKQPSLMITKSMNG